MEKKDIKKEAIIIFWLFIIGSIAGYIFEMIVVLFQKGFIESRQGLIYGPLIPVYGAGIVVYYLILSHVKTNDKIKVFLITALLGGITEYLFSLMQEKIFGTISWDYSHLMFNINGRTSLLHCTYWGIGGILYHTYIIPLIQKLKENIEKKGLRLITSTLSVFIVFDICISFVAANRQLERRMNVPAASKMDIFLDQYYPDEVMDKVYANKKNV